MIDIKGQILAAFGGMLGVCEHIKLNIYSRRANKMQKTCIKRLMRKNKSTVYGKINNFKDVKSIEDYQRIVPLSTYADYDEYVWRMANGEKGLITNRGEVSVFLIADNRYDISVVCKNIHEEVISEHEISFTNPRVIDTIDGVDGKAWLQNKKKERNIPDEDFEQLTLSDKNDINAHLSYVGDKVGSGRDLTKRMLLRYIPKKDVYNKMREFYDDENAIVFGCAGLKGMLGESLNSRGIGLFMFGEVCTNNSVAEFGNLMLSKLVLKKVK